MSGHLKEQHICGESWDITDIHHQAQMDLTCLSGSDVYNAPSKGSSMLCRVHRVGSNQVAVKTGRLTMRFGRAAGNIWASPWSLWRDTPGSEASRQTSEQSASHWPQASLTGQAWSHTSHLQHKQVMTSRSTHWLPQAYVHRGCNWGSNHFKR